MHDGPEQLGLNDPNRNPSISSVITVQTLTEDDELKKPGVRLPTHSILAAADGDPDRRGTERLVVKTEITWADSDWDSRRPSEATLVGGSTCSCACSGGSGSIDEEGGGRGSISTSRSRGESPKGTGRGSLRGEPGEVR